ncbi:response regulator [Corynebacterium aquilae]|uniref:LuxR family transcriptional regulator n=1 Tax=Corynebacterium aquilae DSM 44791 TaxID=1431546 RepID=A0A1L7CE26_9CORY|nr:response regulator transcription factor [Corynebacterium aquilae]APT84101.1 LuxR family transcriptional regulator [Corynebacterium aquilae DSM 44791]
MTRVMIVDDHSMFRAGVRSELAKFSDAVEVVGEAGTVAEAVAGIVDAAPDVVLLDVHMPDGGGLQVLRESLARPEVAARTRFLALSVSDAAQDVIAIIRAGARGYVTKTIASDELVDAVRRVAEGDAVFSPRLAGFVLDAFSRPDASVAAPAPGQVQEAEAEAGTEAEEPEGGVNPDVLTRREREVLRLLARGYTYKEIASELFISIKTVETHASNILRKTQTSNRYALSRWASAHDLD